MHLQMLLACLNRRLFSVAKLGSLHSNVARFLEHQILEDPLGKNYYLWVLGLLILHQIFIQQALHLNSYASKTPNSNLMARILHSVGHVNVIKLCTWIIWKELKFEQKVVAYRKLALTSQHFKIVQDLINTLHQERNLFWWMRKLLEIWTSRWKRWSAPWVKKKANKFYTGWR